jgi:hypothetical protein
MGTREGVPLNLSLGYNRAIEKLQIKPTESHNYVALKQKFAAERLPQMLISAPSCIMERQSRRPATAGF